MRGMVDMSYEIDESTRFFTLVCNKTKNSYHNRYAEYQNEVRSMEILAYIFDQLPVKNIAKLNNLQLRLREAIKR